ncbi:MAG: T9SS type A sorting domain-containing protein [Chitinophagales bacterium]|nr:T9SS type A sorting domain-containing protein [Chitinophagales bacterium]
MRNNIFIWFLLPINIVLGQNTWYDLYNEHKENILTSLKLQENTIFVSRVSPGMTESNPFLSTDVVSFDLNGNVSGRLMFNELIPAKYDAWGYRYAYGRLQLLDKNLIISGHITDRNLETKCHVFSTDLEENKSFSIFSVDGIITGNEGICVDDSILYIYGLLLKDNVDYANVIKYNMNQQTIIWDKIYKKGIKQNQIWDFKKTHDGNFIFINYHSDAYAGSGGNSGYQIVKIDPSGAILDTFSYKDPTIDRQNILISKEGNIYYTTQNNPFDHIIPTNGRINKLSIDMDTVLWSLELPSNAFTDGNKYRIFDYFQAANGDIMACGTVWYMPGEPLKAGLNAGWNGFLARVSQSGELIWIRNYRLFNTHTKLPRSEFGDFRSGQLVSIAETEDGHFILGGTAGYTNTQRFGLGVEDTISSLWIMVVDGMGCIDGEECEDVIHLSEKKMNNNHQIGDTWYYETEAYFGGGNSSFSYKSFSIQDTLFDGTYNKYVLNTQDTFYMDNSKMYFWDWHFKEYIMYYDFKATEPYDVKYYNQFNNTEEIATIIIDSISYMHFGNDSLKVQHIHILNSGTYENYHEVVYEGIGAGHYDIKFLLGCGFCDNNPITTHLRCFTNQEMTYQFVSYACDSTWLISNTVESAEDKILTFPNPAEGTVFIKGVIGDIPYEVYTVDGRLIQHGIMVNQSLNLDASGVFILRLFQNGVWINRRIVNM